MLKPLEIYLQSNPPDTALSNQEILINGTYVDHDVKQKHGSHIIEKWSCV